MAQVLNLKILGLYTHPNVLSEAPLGALGMADNIVIERESIASTRRGFAQYNDPIVGNTPVERLFQYSGTLLAQSNNKLSYDNGIGWTQYTNSYQHPDGDHKIRSVEANKNFYFNTAAGVFKIDSLANEPIKSGAPRGLGGIGSLDGATGFLSNDSSVAYRVVWGYEDENKSLILGTPSQRLVVSNSSGGTRDVALTYSIPDDVQTNWIFFVYRSNESATALDVPDDELQLVYENNPTQSEINNQSISIIDTTLNELKGGALYTNQSQQTILQTNDRAPFCKDMATYKEHIFYANTRTQHRFELALIAVDGALGLGIGDTITIAGTVYTGAASENTAANQFLVELGGTPSQNIDTTTLSLIRVINLSASNTDVYAYYLSGFEDIPGRFLIEERGVGGSSFPLTSSKDSCWAPRLPSSGTSSSSDNEDRPNRIYISKLQQPEAVPLTNFIEVGSANEEIQRVIALRDSIMVFKEDGIFRITGTTLPFSVYPFNDSVELRGLETAVVLDNRIFAMSDQGVIALSDSGVEIMSRPIERTLLSLTAEQFTNFSSVSFALAYESERSFIFYTVTETTDTVPTQAYVYNTITNAWTRWDVSNTAGIVKETDDKIYVGRSQDGQVLQERKSLTRRDYTDREFPVTVQITIVDDNLVTVNTTTNIVPGMTIEQGVTQGIVDEVIDGNTFTVTEPIRLDAGAATMFEPIKCTLAWIPQFAENPGIVKHWRDAIYIFDDATFDDVEVGFSTNFTRETTYPMKSLIANTAFGGRQWGIPQWGTTAWGGEDFDRAGATVVRTLIPVPMQRSIWLNTTLVLNEAFAAFSVAGISLTFQNVSQKIR